MFCVYAKHHILTANNTYTHGHKSFSLIDPRLDRVAPQKQGA